MDWEVDPHPAGRRRRGGTGRAAAGVVAVVAAAAVVAVGLVARSGTGEAPMAHVASEDPGGALVVAEPSPAGGIGPPVIGPADDDPLHGLDRHLDVAVGRWTSVPLPADLDPHRSPEPWTAVWDGTGVVAVLGREVRRMDAAGRWQALPDLPAAPQRGLRAVAVDRTVLVADTAGTTAGPDDVVGPTWALSDGGWGRAGDLPAGGTPIGIADGAVVTAVPAPRGDPGAGGRLWTSTVEPGPPAPLPPPDGCPQPTRVVDLPGPGFALLCAAPADPTASTGAAGRSRLAVQRRTPEGWSALDLPAMSPYSAAAAWVPGALGLGSVAAEGGGSTSPPADGPGAATAGVLLVAGRSPEGGLRLVAIDLGTGDVEVVTAELTASAEAALRSGGLLLVHDGAGTAWVHAGYHRAVQLEVDLATGRLAVAAPAGGRAGSELTWAGGGLWLIGGLGPGGPVDDVARWSRSASG